MGPAGGKGRTVTLERCRDPGFTPGARDVAPLVELWERTVHDDGPRAARVVVQALARGERGVARALVSGWAEVEGEHRAMRLRVLSRIAGRMSVPELGPLLPRALADAEPRVVREAARAVGKLLPATADVDPSVHEQALLAIVDTAQRPEQRAAVEALGRIGSAAALARLQALTTDDADLARRRAQALTLIARRLDREQVGDNVLDRPLPEPAEIWLRCRVGAGASVMAQARARLPGARRLRIEQRDLTAVRLRGSLSLAQLYRVRSATEVALSFPLPHGDDVVERIVTGLAQPALEASLCAWTSGAPRFRLAFARQGRRRAVVWDVAKRLRERGSPLRNDTRAVNWTIEVELDDRRTNGPRRPRLLCIPRRDPRFEYRQQDVPAATHPTFAALLAWAGAPRPGEVVWDPFCGSGCELIEAAQLEPDLHLWGSDVSAAAIEAARANVQAAQIDPARVHLRNDDARSVHPRHGERSVSLILSNPPMGRRVVVEDRGMRPLLDDFIAHAARVLAPGGRMVWLSPAPRHTANTGRRHGLDVEDLDAIELGGFFATPQVLRKRA